MSDRRWTRFLPSRSKLALAAALLLLAWASIAFLDLAAAKNQALTQHRQAVHKIGVAQGQNEMLHRALDGAQAKQNIIPKAYQYFGWTPKDQTLIVPKIAPADETPAVQQTGPADPWAGLAERLGRTLTNLLNRVE